MNQSDLRSKWNELSNKYSIFMVLAVMFVICSFLSPVFCTEGNIANISRQISITTIIAFGETLLIICGLLDLSAGSVVALAGLLSVAAFKSTNSLLLSMLVGIVIGIGCNFINGLMVTKFKAPPFIATLAMMTAARGAALMFTGGQNIYQIGKFVIWGQSNVSIIPTPVIFMIGITFITWYLLKQTKFGRYLYAVGGNQEAARASGISINRIKMQAYLINGVFVGLAGVIFMSRVNAGLPNSGAGFEFDAMTAAIIGGTSFSGGIGTALGTLAGGFIMGLLNNIMNLTLIQSYVQQIVKGAIIALAVIYDIHAKTKRESHTIGNIEESVSLKSKSTAQ
jgi:inositol transport system permease protein